MGKVMFLRIIVIISLVAVVSLSCFSIFFLPPSFADLIIRAAEQESIKVGRHLAEPLRGQGRLDHRLRSDFKRMAREAVDDFGLMKIKVFAADGETVYSTSAEDIGKVNEREYFHNIVAKGEVLTKVVSRDSKTLEGQVVKMDVVETYVPIIESGRFIGAFELYLDITDKNNRLYRLISRSNTLLLVIAATLIAAVVFVSFIARRSFMKQESAELEIIKQSLHLQEKNNELSLLNEVAKVLSRSLDLKVMLPLLLETLVERLAVSKLVKMGGIFLVKGENMELAAHLGHDDEFLELHRNITVNDCLCGQAARTGEIIISENSQEDSFHTISCAAMQPHGHIIVPLKSAHKVVGVLYLYLPADMEIEEVKVNLLENIAVQIGMAIENANLYAETEKMALYDHLTGLANRRSMDANLKKAVSLAERHNRPLSVVLFDIDFFKKYNDSFGHETGDRLLAEVAEKIATGSRATDMAARYGGEEFLVIMPESDLDGACQVAERIRRNIAESLVVTVSAGVAVFKRGFSYSDLIKTADAALYRAKEAGRNRVECV